MADFEDRKNALIRELDRSRALVSDHAHALRTTASPATKLRNSFSRNRFTWIGTAVLGGIILAKFRPRAKKVIVERKTEKQSTSARSAGIALALGKILFDIAKPFISRWATERVSQMTSNGVPSGMSARSGAYRS